MPELRQNRFTKEWVIIATERAKRPEEFQKQRAPRPALPKYSPKCPFCPGNEYMAPPPVLCCPQEKDWQVRVVPNKFPALNRDGELWVRVERSKRVMNGLGVHDVIIETPDHSLTTAVLPIDSVANVLRCYKRRFDEVSKDPRIAHVTIFKNYGRGAGTSLEHPHSQLIATPVISSQVRHRMYEAIRHYDEFRECMFCQAIAEDLQDDSRVILRSRCFIAVEPFASSTPFATYIYPLRHMASFGGIAEDEIVDLAHVLKTVLGKMYSALNDPDFNYTIRTAPAESAGVTYYHWYLSIIPRLTQVAGFELGTGMFINTVLPEDAAAFLRGIQTDTAAAS